MDYSYSEKETVRLDYNTERAIYEIKDTLKQVASGLDNLTRKVDKLAGQRHMESQDESRR